MEENNKEEVLKEEVTPKNNENEIEVVKSEQQTQRKKLPQKIEKVLQLHQWY